MKFIREVTIDHLTPDMIAMEKQGDLTLIWHESTIEIWASVPKGDK